MLIICSSILVTTTYFGNVKAQSGTQVSGIITTNTTWTKANSPYTLTAPVGIPINVDLIIENGVAVNLNNYYIQVNGTINAIGTIDFLIEFNSGEIRFTKLCNGWNETTATGCIIENAVFNYTQITIDYCSPKINKNTFVHSDTAPIKIDSSNSTISNNTISATGNIAVEISNSHWVDTVPIIEANAIVGSNIGIRAYFAFTGYPIIRNNTITNNNIGIFISASSIYQGIFSPVILYNNIYSNNNYNIQTSSNTGYINATYNWWGTTNTSIIDKSIFDFTDDFTLGIVSYLPFLSSPNLVSPVAPEPTPTPTPSYTIKFVHIGEGVISPSDGKHVLTSPIVLTATPATNYEFMCWLENGTVLSTNNPYTYYPNNDYVITAVFYDPVAKPTSTPTTNPTNQPTSNPTSNPTTAPTSNPTASHTSSPSPKPTSNPSSTPTVPELSVIVILPLLMALFSVAVLLRKQPKIMSG